MQTRIDTLDAIKKAGLELYYCVEPIGPEHTNAEICSNPRDTTEDTEDNRVFTIKKATRCQLEQTLVEIIENK